MFFSELFFTCLPEIILQGWASQTATTSHPIYTKSDSILFTYTFTHKFLAFIVDKYSLHETAHLCMVNTLKPTFPSFHVVCFRRLLASLFLTFWAQVAKPGRLDGWIFLLDFNKPFFVGSAKPPTKKGPEKGRSPGLKSLNFSSWWFQPI